VSRRIDRQALGGHCGARDNACQQHEREGDARGRWAKESNLHRVALSGQVRRD